MSTAIKREAGIATGMSLLIPITLSTMAIVLLAPVLPKMFEEFKDVKGHEWLVPMILTVPALCVAIFSTIAGALGDYFGRRKLLMISMAVYGVIGLAPLVLTNIYYILISRIGVGIAEALIMTMSTTMIADYFTGEKRNGWLAAQTAVASISATLFFILGGALGELGWRAPFVVYSTAFLMLAGVVLFTWEQDQETTEDGIVHKLQSVSWAGFPWARMGGIVVVTLFASILFYTVQIQNAPALVAHGVTQSSKIGLMSAVASLGVPLGTLVYSKFSKTPVWKLLIIEFTILAIGFIMMTQTSQAGSFLMACAVNQFGAGMLLPTLLVWAVSGLKFEFRARGTGIWTAVFSLGQFLSPLTITILMKKITGNSLLSSFQYLGFAAIIAVILLAFIRPQQGNVDTDAS